MKAYSIDLREKIVSAAEKGDLSIRKIAQRFTLSKNLVQKLVKQKRTEGHIVPRKQGGMVSPVMKYKDQLIAIVEKQADATLAEYCELSLFCHFVEGKIKEHPMLPVLVTVAEC